MEDLQKKKPSRKREATRIELLPISEILPYAKNPRKNEKSVKFVKESIRQFGFKVPIIIDSKREIVCGHTRLLAAKSLGLSEVPCIVADDLTDEQIKAFRLADNKVGEFSDWDLDLLNNELSEIAEIDMGDFGFDLSEDEEETEVVEDEVPGEVESICNKGGIWRLGEHRLMCGDSTSVNDVTKLMNGEMADMCFTDPPYGVSYEGGLNDVKRKQIKNDALRGDSLYNFLVPVFENIKSFTIQKAAIYIFYAHPSTLQFINALYDAKLKQRSILIWKKIGGGFGDFMAQYMNAYEPCIYASNGDSVNWYGPTNEKTIWEMEKERVCDLHPTMKPIPLVGRAISNSSKKGDIVIDLFGGSGSTIIACEQLGRKCRMMELDPHYCDVIIARWEKLTGKKAEKIGG